MKPKPFVMLNHFTTPVAMASLLKTLPRITSDPWLDLRGRKPARSKPRVVIVRPSGPHRAFLAPQSQAEPVPYALSCRPRDQAKSPRVSAAPSPSQARTRRSAGYD